MARFQLGRIVGTPAALQELEAARQTASEFLDRHLREEWGDLCEEDKQLNCAALDNGGRLFSAYHLHTGVKIWIITEADYSVTTVLLPEDY